MELQLPSRAIPMEAVPLTVMPLWLVSVSRSVAPHADNAIKIATKLRFFISAPYKLEDDGLQF